MIHAKFRKPKFGILLVSIWVTFTMSMHPKCEYPTLLLMNIVGHTIEGLLNLFPHYKHRGIITWVFIKYPSTRLNITSSHYTLQYLYGIENCVPCVPFYLTSGFSSRNWAPSEHGTRHQIYIQELTSRCFFLKYCSLSTNEYPIV